MGLTVERSGATPFLGRDFHSLSLKHLTQAAGLEFELVHTDKAIEAPNLVDKALHDVDLRCSNLYP